MSMFLPTGASQTQPPSGVADITPPDPETSSADIALMQRVLSAASRNPNLIPADFMSYLLDWIQTQRLTIPVGQVFGIDRATQASRVHLSANQTYPTGLQERLNYDTVDYDYGGLWDPTNHQFAVSLKGKYIIGCGVSWAANATGLRNLTIQLNGTEIQSITFPNQGSGSDTDVDLVTAYDLSVGDALRVTATQSSGGNLDVLAGVVTNFWIHRTGA